MENMYDEPTWFERQVMIFKAWQCRRFGHKIVCDSHACPESGSDELECTRCGWSHTEIYY